MQLRKIFSTSIRVPRRVGISSRTLGRTPTKKIQQVHHFRPSSSPAPVLSCVSCTRVVLARGRSYPSSLRCPIAEDSHFMIVGVNVGPFCFLFCIVIFIYLLSRQLYVCTLDSCFPTYICRRSSSRLSNQSPPEPTAVRIPVGCPSVHAWQRHQSILQCRLHRVFPHLH